MTLSQYKQEELKELSMIELAHEVLVMKKQATSFSEIVREIAEILELSQEQVNARLSQFYTDLNIDGRYISLGENRWGLRSWYPYEQIDEEILPQPKPKKKRKYAEDEADEFLADVDDFDELDEIDDLDEDLEEDEIFLEDEAEDEEIDEEIDEDFEDDMLTEEEELEAVDDDEDFVDEDEAEYDDLEEEEDEM